VPDTPSLDPLTGKDPSSLGTPILAERLATERALRESWILSHAQLHLSESDARDKAERGIDKRLEGMNEFRDQLRDQASTFLQITVFEAWKEEYRRAHDELRNQIIDLQKADLATGSRGAGVARGQGMVIAAIVGSISVAGSILGLIIVLSNILTKS
jgi:hypothetical protein